MSPPNSRVFSGQMVHFRLWKTRKTLKEIRVLMMEQYDQVATRDLLIHLRYDLRAAGPKTTTKRVMNGDQTVSEAHGIQLKIVEFLRQTNSGEYVNHRLSYHNDNEKM